MNGATMALFVMLGAVVACTGTPNVVPSPTTTASPTAGPPKFEVSSYQYAIQVHGKLRVGTREDISPFAFKGTTGRYEGFDPDLAREIAKAIFGPAADADPDRFIEWVPLVSATLITALSDGKADIVMAALEVTEERAKQIDLSAPYFHTGQRLLVKRDEATIKDFADLNLKTVCTVRGSASEKDLIAKVGTARLLSIDTYASCLTALKQGAADAVSADESILFGLVTQDATTKIVGSYLSDVPLAIGVRQGRASFVRFLDSLVAKTVQDGRWAAIYKKDVSPVSRDTRQGPQATGVPVP